jgi:hypothetical protein
LDCEQSRTPTALKPRLTPPPFNAFSPISFGLTGFVLQKRRREHKTKAALIKINERGFGLLTT